MKTISLLFLVALFGKSYCSYDLQKESKHISFEYEVLTKGFYNKIIAKQDTLLTIHGVSQEQVTTAEISKNDWKTLINLLGKTNLETFDKIKKPTDKRASDGILYATFKIIYKDKSYESNTFDAGNPRKEEIINTMITLSNKKQE